MFPQNSPFAKAQERLDRWHEQEQPSDVLPSRPQTKAATPQVESKDLEDWHHWLDRALLALEREDTFNAIPLIEMVQDSIHENLR